MTESDEVMPNADIKKSAVLAILFVLCSRAAAGFAGETPPVRVSAEISNITYENNDEYRVEITTANKSGEALVLKGFEPHFFAQSEILGQWIELSGRSAGGRLPGTGLVIPGGGTWMTAGIVSIPRAAPHLFRNHEGDVNILFKYTLTFTGAASQKQEKGGEESAYWLTPGTSRWVLREGM